MKILAATPYTLLVLTLFFFLISHVTAQDEFVQLEKREVSFTVTQDLNMGGRICMEGECISKTGAAYLGQILNVIPLPSARSLAALVDPTPANISFQSTNYPTTSIMTVNAATESFKINPVAGTTDPSSYLFSLTRVNPPVSVGCFYWNGTSLLTRNNGMMTLSQCYQTAIRRNDRYFGLTNFGRSCFSGNATNFDTTGYQLSYLCMYSCSLDSATSTLGTRSACGDASSFAIYSIQYGVSEPIKTSIPIGSMVILLYSKSFKLSP